MDTEKTAQPFDPASFEHVPVLLNECLDGLKIDPAGTYLDGTAGGAGHSRQIALRLNGEQGGRLISLDQDPDAVQTARARLAGLPATVVQINFRYAGQALEQLGIETINGALLDLGVSSHQLDDAARGFSYRADAPLDMRMSQEGETAADLVNSESREELARILRDYGEEPFAWQDAQWSYQVELTGIHVPGLERMAAFTAEIGDDVYTGCRWKKLDPAGGKAVFQAAGRQGKEELA